MKSSRRLRITQLRDSLLLYLTKLSLTVMLILIAGRIFQRNAFHFPLKGYTEELAVAFGLLALLAGAVYIFLAPPCQVGADGRIKDP